MLHEHEQITTHYTTSIFIYHFTGLISPFPIQSAQKNPAMLVIARLWTSSPDTNVNVQPVTMATIATSITPAYFNHVELLGHARTSVKPTTCARAKLAFTDETVLSLTPAL